MCVCVRVCVVWYVCALVCGLRCVCFVCVSVHACVRCDVCMHVVCVCVRVCVCVCKLWCVHTRRGGMCRFRSVCATLEDVFRQKSCRPAYIKPIDGNLGERENQVNLRGTVMWFMDTFDGLF